MSAWFAPNHELDDHDQYEAMRKWLQKALTGDIDFKAMRTMDELTKGEGAAKTPEQENGSEEEEGDEEKDEL